MKKKKLEKPKDQKLTILGKNIDLVFEEESPEGTLSGVYRGNKVTIYLTEHKNSTELTSTVLHELIHVVLDITGHSARLTEGDEESLVRAIENGLGELVTLKFLDQ